MSRCAGSDRPAQRQRGSGECLRLLTDEPPGLAGRLDRRLLDRGVLVRDVGIPHHLRVTAGTEAETTAFLTALAEVLGETGHRS